jgi:hypothetical protein
MTCPRAVAVTPTTVAAELAITAMSGKNAIEATIRATPPRATIAEATD